MTKIETNLFIGGRSDGERKELPSDYRTRDLVRIPFIADKAMGLHNANGGTLETGISHEVYRRQSLAAEGQTFDFWLLDGMTGQDALTELLAGYRPARKPVAP